MLASMDEIPISKFKASCAAVIAGVAKTRRRVVITRRGKPVAEIVPPSRPKRTRSWLGCMAGTAEFVGDIVGPAWSDWEKDLERKWDRKLGRPLKPGASDP